MVGFMQLITLNYEVKGDTLELSMEMMGEKETMQSKFKIEGDTLTIIDEEGGTMTLKRAK